MNAYGGVPSSLVTGTNVNVPTAPPQEGFPPRSIDQFRSGMIPPPHIQMQQQQQQQAMLRMGGPPADTQWMQQGGPMIHRVPVLSTDDASVASKPFAVATPTSSSPAKDSSSFDSQEVAHSVLLLAAGVPKKRESKDDDDESVERVPLKKRKINSILRHKTTESAPCNVSPMSNGSKALSAESAARTSSYDLKDGQALPDSAKISNTNDICSPPAHVIIPHFPSVLHSLLTDSEFSGSVIQWLPHGQAWRIVRWDALRRQVLPKFFPQLSEEDGKRSSGSIDAFLWHLSAWGFEEIPHGPDAGAYTNVVSLKSSVHEMCWGQKLVCACVVESLSHSSWSSFYARSSFAAILRTFVVTCDSRPIGETKTTTRRRHRHLLVTAPFSKFRRSGRLLAPKATTE